MPRNLDEKTAVFVDLGPRTSDDDRPIPPSESRPSPGLAASGPSEVRGGGGVVDLARWQPAVSRLDLMGGDSITFSGTAYGRHVRINTSDDEEIAECLVACGAVVTSHRRTTRSVDGAREWEETTLEHDGAGVYLSTPHRDAPDLVGRLAETADRVAAGETLAQIAAKPLRAVK